METLRIASMLATVFGLITLLLNEKSISLIFWTLASTLAHWQVGLLEKRIKESERGAIGREG